MKNLLHAIFFVGIIFTLCVDAFAMDDVKFLKILATKNTKEIPSKNSMLKQLKQDNKDIRLIIGRGNTEDNHTPLPNEGQDNVVWVYTDVNLTILKNIDGKPYIWLDFDDVAKVQELEQNSFTMVMFDWSVLKFFSNLDQIIPELKNLLKPGGQLIIPAGEQTGMVSVYSCPLEIEEKKYPVRAQTCLQNQSEAFPLIANMQMAYLHEVFGDGHVTLVTDEKNYPACLEPEKGNNLNKYFIAVRPEN